MTFLPIVDRELRAAARRRGTFRLRWLVVLIGLIMTFGALFFLAEGAGPKNVGRPLFEVLTICAFFLCPLLGVSLTADSLSEEKREGTLGLLFLTDLKGYDVVLGKFAASSLNAFYGLFALLPILALPLLIGGVTGGQFLRVSLVLVNALFFCLAAGIFVSSLARQSRAAIAGTFWLLLLVTAVFPAAKRLGEFLHVPQEWFTVTAISPFYPYLLSADVVYRSHAAQFWRSFAASHLAGWLFVALASIALPRVWRETASGLERPRRLHPLEIGGSANPERRRDRKSDALSINPVLWVIGREPKLRFGVWVIVCVWGASVLLTTQLWPREPEAVYYFGRVCAFLFKMLVAVQACRFFAESRRNGLLEMLLYTPLRTADILRGQWLALSQIFLIPLFVFLFFNLVPVAVAFWSVFSGNGFSEGKRTLFAVGGGGLLFTITLVADVFAVCWFGMWLALTLKKPALAPLLTIIFVLVVPSFFCVLDLVADFFFILWGVSRLQRDFRYRFGRQYEPVRAGPSPPATIIHSSAPPLIKA